MNRLHKINPAIAKLLVLGLLTTPVLAHEVKVKQDVAITFHIDPHDQPKANQPTKAWFLVTRRGGKAIPLSACNCQLTVYAVSDPKAQRPWVRLPLKPFARDRDKNLMAASITFPKVGLYELKLTGMAKPSSSFQPFVASYKVTVTAP